MKFVYSFIIALVIGIGVFWLTFAISTTVDPPYTYDANGEMRVHMATGALFLGLIVGVLVGLILFIWLVKRWKAIMDWITKD